MSKFVFGITGGTGAGKSTVSEYFRKLGVNVIDADVVSRRVTERGMPCLAELTEEFGIEILNDDMTLNRRLLGNIVFSQTDKLERLTDITHKYIKEYIEREINGTSGDIAAIDGAVIIGSPVMELCEKTVVVTADEETRLKRIMRRDGISEKAARARISSQMTAEKYLEYADYIVENNGNDPKIGEKIERLYSEIKNLSTSKSEKA